MTTKIMGVQKMSDRKNMGKNDVPAHEQPSPGTLDIYEGTNAPSPENAPDGQQEKLAAMQTVKAEIVRVLRVRKPLMKGDDVKALHKALVAAGVGVSTDCVNGEYGAATAQAVRFFQNANNLKVTGVVDQTTALLLGGPWTGPNE